MHAVWIAVVVVLLAIGQTLYYNRRALRRVQYSRSFSRSRVRNHPFRTISQRPAFWCLYTSL